MAVRLSQIARLILLVTLTIGGVAWSPAPVAAAGWDNTGPLPPWEPDRVATYPGAKLGDFTATALPDGRVLAVGGFLIKAGALYNSATNAWTATAPLTRERYRHTATLLADGRVLVVGGWASCCTTPFGSRDAERYDSVINTWSPAAPMAELRANHTATLLDDGTVLVVGGDYRNASPSNPMPQTYATAERYNPVTDTWQPAAAMAVARVGHTATRLPDGSVLVVGGDAGGTAERFYPATNIWAPVAAPLAQRRGHTATLLHDGTVLVIGGGAGDASLASVERYDPKTNAWAAAAPLAVARYGHSATLVTDGTVIVAGGKRNNATTEASVERYDAVDNFWTTQPAMNRARTGHAAVLLNGEVVAVGGETAGANPTAEAFDSGAPEVCFAETGRCLRGRFLDYWLANGGLARNGFPLSDEFAERLEDGRIYRVQYFERVRLESHPQNTAPFDVLLGQFGRRVHPADPPLPPASGALPADRVYFPETGHYIIGRFFNYWYVNGGLAQFGYPITEELDETLEDGKTYRVQYFERGRLEYHPENAGTPYEVLLGQFGRRFWGGR